MGHFSPLKDIKVTRDRGKLSSKNRLDHGPGQILVQNNLRPGQHRAFFSLKEIRNNPGWGQNLVLKIDWTRAYFGPGQILAQKQRKTGAKLRTQNRLDRSTADQLAQNNPRPGQNNVSVNSKPDHPPERPPGIRTF